MSDPFIETQRPRRGKPAGPTRPYGPRRAVLSPDGTSVVAVLEGRDITDQDIADCLRCLAMAPSRTPETPSL